jgi:hypothetical protein
LREISVKKRESRHTFLREMCVKNGGNFRLKWQLNYRL